MPSINDFITGFSDGLPGMKDYRHASRLYIDDNFKLMPKQKFLFHVVFDIDNTIPVKTFSANEQLELNMLVKACDLPKYNLNYEEKQQYNKKTYIATRIGYEAVNITFHDDHADTVNAFWKTYYEYNIADPVTVSRSGTIVNGTRDNMYDEFQITTQHGLDTPKQRKKPFLRNIQIFALHKQRFTAFTLINPVITSFAHDNLDQTDGAGLMQNTMQIMYETVLYGAGLVNKIDVPGFATIHYDHEPSPLSVMGRGTNSIFGPGGIVDGIGSVIGDIRTGNFGLGTVIKGINTYNRAKKIKAKAAVKEELKGIVKKEVIDFGKNAGTITNPVGNYTIGNVAVQAATIGATIAIAKGMIDKNDNTATTVIPASTLDSVTYLTADESYNLINDNATLRDKIASNLYYKDVGSRKGLSIAQSDVEYTGSTSSIKSIYRSKAITNIRKLVTEGYIKISRDTLDVTIVTEKEGL